jgi:hypothetical protein
MATQNSVELWRGASLFDGTPIVVIATGLRRGSRNAKTGAMVQTWILRADMNPVAAVKGAVDDATCGTCPHRAGAGCYVDVSRAPLSVWRSWKAGRIPLATETDRARVRSLALRIGSYGDPGAVPVAVWQAIVTDGQRRAGYTHAWRTRPDLQGLCMASADSAAEHHVARSKGWRTFRVLPVLDDVEGTARPGEIECLAESRGKSCIDCGLCHGAHEKSARASIFIRAHGAKASRVGLAILQ